MIMDILTPMIYADLPDDAVVRVGENYYMISTSMHSFPGCPILKSTDLVNWELVSYVFDRLEDTPGTTLEDGIGIYGKGAWAVSFKYHEGMFYCAFSCNDTKSFYVYKTDDIEHGAWTYTRHEGLRHDPAILFDEGRAYVIYGAGDITIEEWESDMSAPKKDGICQMLLSTPKDDIMLRCEGGHVFRIDNTYYLIYIEWPYNDNNRRRQICYRSNNLLGPYERKLIFDEDNGYRNRGIAQGEIFDTPDGKWYAMLFQDHDAVGRIPFLLPVSWENGWPMVQAKVTEAKCNCKSENMVGKIDVDNKYMLSGSDDFDYKENKLNLKWQWNHHPDNELWSVTEKPGVLRLKTGRITDCVVTAVNTLTQRTYGPKCAVETCVHSAGMKVGDFAGLVAMQGMFGAIGIRKKENGLWVEQCFNDGNKKESIVCSKAYDGEMIYFRIEYDFGEGKDVAEFYISDDGECWENFGQNLNMQYTLDHFMGNRAGLFNYASEETGGFADFEFFNFYMR